VEECAGIGISGVGLKPDTGRLARFDVACNQRRLARARRARDPRRSTSYRRGRLNLASVIGVDGTDDRGIFTLS
jgi:hypothetical protein